MYNLLQYSGLWHAVACHDSQGGLVGKPADVHLIMANVEWLTGSGPSSDFGDSLTSMGRAGLPAYTLIVAAIHEFG